MSQPPNQPYNPNQPIDPNQYAQQQQYMAQQEYAAQQAAPKRRFGPKQILSAILIVAAVGFIGWQLWSSFQTNQALQVGKCITISGESANNVSEKEVDCSDATQTSYEVVQTADSESQCPAETSSYSITSKRRSGATKTVKVACLIENLHKDTCYSFDGNNRINSLAVSECTPGTVKVTERIDQANASCAEGEPFSYPVPGRTYCLVPNE